MGPFAPCSLWRRPGEKRSFRPSVGLDRPRIGADAVQLPWHGAAVRKADRERGPDAGYLSAPAADGQGRRGRAEPGGAGQVRAHETGRNLVCRLLLEKKKNDTTG